MRKIFVNQSKFGREYEHIVYKFSKIGGNLAILSPLNVSFGK